MAVDTANKRFSMMTLGRPGQPPLFVPDGSIGQGDRQALLGLYSGIAAEEPTAGGARGGMMVNPDRMMNP